MVYKHGGSRLIHQACNQGCALRVRGRIVYTTTRHSTQHNLLSPVVLCLFFNYWLFPNCLFHLNINPNVFITTTLTPSLQQYSLQANLISSLLSSQATISWIMHHQSEGESSKKRLRQTSLEDCFGSITKRHRSMQKEGSLSLEFFSFF